MNESQRTVTLTVDGHTVRVAEGDTILDACRQLAIDTPTMCFADNLTPVNACRVCVVELEGSRTLVACARAAADGMQVRTDSERVRHSRRLVLELLASSVDLSCAGEAVQRWQATYGAEPERFGPPAPDAAPGERERQHAGGSNSECPAIEHRGGVNPPLAICALNLRGRIIRLTGRSPNGNGGEL